MKNLQIIFELIIKNIQKHKLSDFCSINMIINN
jgi:hypothetical protein